MTPPDLDFGPRGPLVAYLLRHGTTDLNDADKFRGWQNPPLNESGRAEAMQAAHHMRYTRLAGIVSSPLMRAAHTAQQIASSSGQQASADGRLLPWNLGWLAGKSRKAFSNALRGYVSAPSKQIPGGESLNEFRARWIPALNDYAVQAEPLGAPWLLVVHTSNIEAARGGLPEQTSLSDPGSLLRVHLEPTGLVLYPDTFLC